jgi:putative membrane protein
MMWGYGGDGFWFLAAISAVLGLAFTIGIIVLIVLAIRWLIRADRNSRLPPSGPGGAAGWDRSGAADDPLEILRQRYARGEIDDEEYERRRRTLTGG